MSGRGPALPFRTEQSSEVHRRALARLGTWLDDEYRLDAIIGIGGMAVVYRAKRRDDAEVAVKMLHADLSMNEGARARFLREGYAASSVSHPGVVKIEGDGVADDGSAFLVMELLDGGSAEALWEENGRSLPPDVVVAIGAGVLDVLASAHAKKVVHRDIKPANVFVMKTGEVKVLDFGIARVRDVIAASGDSTATGVVLGTPAFMAPEQARASSEEIDGQSDVWAVGATLFTLLSGKPVHKDGSPGEVLALAATLRARRLGEIAPDVPEPIAEVIDKALSFEKIHRWASASEMRDALVAAGNDSLGARPGTDVLASLHAKYADAISSRAIVAAPPIRDADDAASPGQRGEHERGPVRQPSKDSLEESLAKLPVLAGAGHGSGLSEAPPPMRVAPNARPRHPTSAPSRRRTRASRRARALAASAAVVLVLCVAIVGPRLLAHRAIDDARTDVGSSRAPTTADASVEAGP